MRPPFETFKGATCKGSYALGSACGNCERCTWERSHMFNDEKQQHIAKLIALREAINDPNATVELKQVFFTLIDCMLDALRR